MGKNKIFLSVLLMCLLLLVTPAAAGERISVLVDNQRLSFDTDPRNVNGRVMVPFRQVGEAMGAKVNWDQDKKIITMYTKDNYVKLLIGNKYMKYGETGGQEKIYELDATPQIIDNRTFVPVRAISEGLKCSVGWDETTKTVVITSNAKGSGAVSPETTETSNEQTAEITPPPAEEPTPATMKPPTSQPIEKGQAPKKTGNLTEPLIKKASSEAEFIKAVKQNIQLVNKTFTIEVNGVPRSLLEGDLFETIDELTTVSTSYNISGNFYDTGGRLSGKVVLDLTYRDYYYIVDAIDRKNPNKLTERTHRIYNEAVNVINKTIKNDMTDYEKEKAIHDYIILNTRYDEENYAKGHVPDDSHSAYGVFVNKVAVCDGYAEAFLIIMHMLGIECDFVHGVAGGVNHAWNRVKIDGEYYLLDLTWDDPTPDKSGEVSYSYFNLTDAEMGKDHKASISTNKAASSTRYNYFTNYGLTFSSQAEFEQKINSAVEGNVTSIHLKGVGLTIADLDLQSIFKYYRGEIFYQISEKANVISIYFK